MEEKRRTQNDGTDFALTVMILDGLVLFLKGKEVLLKQYWVN